MQKRIQKKILYIGRHKDFLLLDCLAYCVGFYLAILIRHYINIPITRADLFSRFGLVGLLVYMTVEVMDQNLNGTVSRSAARELEALAKHMVVSWSVYTAILFLKKDAHEFSRSVYIITFFTCLFCILLVRTIWKALIKYGDRRHLAPRLLIVCDAEHIQDVVDRLLAGTFENKYEIDRIITNKEPAEKYEDHYKLQIGLNRITWAAKNRQIQNAYVELSNGNEEKEVIRKLLEAGLTVHKGLGESRLDFASMRIEDFSYHSVITIDNTSIQFVKKLERFFEKIRKIFRKKETE